MAHDYYKTLGLTKSASEDEIRKAYRELARKYHPDVNADDATAKKKFQEVQAAFDVLNDAKKRKLYDRYGPNFEAFESGAAGGAGPWGQTTGAGPGGQPFHVDLGDVFGSRGGPGGANAGGGFADFFRQFSGGAAGARPEAPRRAGEDIHHELTIPFNTAVLGGEARIAVERPTGRVEEIAVKIPAGISDGKKIRLRGQGDPAPRGGEAGDLLIQVKVAPHPYFKRRGNRLDVRLPVTLAEAVAGAKVDVPTPKGTITLQIPPGTSSGKKLRVRGHGVAPKGETAGDLFAEVMIVLPDAMSPDDAKSVADAVESYTYNPRSDLKW